MGQLQQVPLAQCNYIKPSANEITAYIDMLNEVSLEGIVNKCIFSRDQWENFVESFLGEKGKSSGECFGKSVTLCSILRTLGYSEKNCFIIIACHFSENFGNATHATLLLNKDDEWFNVDTTKENMNDAIQKIPSILGFTTHNRAICLFNDTYGFIAEGDGIISSIPDLR